MPDMVAETSTDQSTKRTIAVISGKGGSGKTMIAALMARITSDVAPVILMDADTGTAGMSYYLTLKYVENVNEGVAEVMLHPSQYENELPLRLLHWKGQFPAQFLPIGDHRQLYDAKEIDPRSLARIVRQLSNPPQFVVIDCRGGIDPESISVCEAADDIFLIVEPDTTSFQATKHVMDVLSARGLARKARGFIINKVFEDPDVISRNGSSLFKCRCLGAVPFDLEATRDFLVGNVPELDTQFAIQVCQALKKAYPKVSFSPAGRPWSFEEFGQVSLTNPEGARGGLLAAAFILVATMLYGTGLYLAQNWRDSFSFHLSFAVLFAYFGILGSLEWGRRLLGRCATVYIRILAKLAGIRSRKF